MADTLTAARRRRGPDRRLAPMRALAAAAVRLPTGNRDLVRKYSRKPQEWQTDSWEYFDAVPEVKFLGWWVGNLLALVRLFPAVELPDGTVVAIDAVDEKGARMSALVGISDELAERAVAEWKRLGNHEEIQRELAMNLEIAAEGYLVGHARKPATLGDPARNVPPTPEVPEHWEIRSISEVHEKDGQWFVRSEPGKDGEALGPDDDCIRLYQRHPRWKALADCNLRAVIEECRLLQVLNGQMYAEHASKAAAGAFTWPKGLSITKVQPGPEPDEGAEPEQGDEALESAGPMEDIVVALTDPGHDPMDLNSRVPFLIEGEAELLKPDVLRKIDFSRQSGPELDARINARCERLARGVAAPVEVILGHRNTTFANAEQIDENEYDDFLQPRVQLLADVLAEGYLRPQISAPVDAGPAVAPLPPTPNGQQAGIVDPRLSPILLPPQLDPTPAFPAELVNLIIIGSDPTPIIGTPDLSESADEALDRFAVSREAYRKMKRIPEDYAPDEAEVLTMLALRRGTADANLTVQLLKALDPTLELPPAPAAAPGAPAGDDEEEPDPEAAQALAAAAAQARQWAVEQIALATVGAQMLGLNPATLPALGMGAPPGPPARAGRG